MADPIDAPPLGWLFQRQRRHTFWQYWLRDTLWGSFYAASHHVLRLTSIDACSFVGEVFGDVTRRFVDFHIGEMRRHRGHEAQARANWALLRSQDAAPQRVEAAMATAFRNAACANCEFAVLDRLWGQGRIAVEGAEHLSAARETGRPVMVAAVHLGNWEVVGPSLAGLGYPATTIYQQPPNRFDHTIVVKARERAGMKLVPVGRGRGRIAFRALADAREMLLIYLDEYVGGRVSAPFFGRRPRTTGNIGYAARMAALADAIVIPAVPLRLEGANFRVTYLPPVALACSGDREADLAENVVRLNAVIEPIVREHLDQWLWLFDYRPDV